MSQSFSMGDKWTPDQTVQVQGRNIYLWIIIALVLHLSSQYGAPPTRRRSLGARVSGSRGFLTPLLL